MVYLKAQNKVNYDLAWHKILCAKWFLVNLFKEVLFLRQHTSLKKKKKKSVQDTLIIFILHCLSLRNHSKKAALNAYI